MITGNFSIKSACSLAKAADTIEGTVISLYVYPLKSKLNYVFAIANDNHSGELESILSKDFVSFRISHEKDMLMIQGVKKGHGVMGAMIDSNCIPVFPIIARNGQEFFNYASLFNKASDVLQESIERTNKIETFDFEKTIGNDFITGIPKKWGILNSMDLTDTERKLVKAAFKMGFYEWPRVYDLNLMKNDYKLSKPTLLYHLRKAEKKIMQTIFE